MKPPKFPFQKTTFAVWLFFLFLMVDNPALQAQWSKTSGPPGISVNVLYQSGNTLFAGTSSQGVFKSKDHGTTWSGANSGIENRSVFALISDGSYLYAGTDIGVYRSSDNGTSWSAANNGIQTNFIISFVVANGYVFAGTTGFGLFKSNNQGSSWTNANGGALDQTSILAVCFSGKNLIVLGDDIIFYSTNNGNSWFSSRNSPFIFSSTSSFLVQGDSVMITAISGIFRSFDSGQSWGSFISVNPNSTISGLARSGNTIYAGTAAGLFSSKNFGKTWKAITATGLRVDNRINHTFYKSGTKLLLAFDEVGVASSGDNGKNWVYSLTGFTPASNIDNAVTVSGNLMLSGTHSDGIYQSSDEGSTWNKLGSTAAVDSLSNGIVFSVLKTGDVILAGTCGFGLYRSTDNGTTFVRIRNGLPQQKGTAELCINALAQCSGNILAATDQGLFYSTDNGQSWNPSNIPTGNAEVIGVAANDSVACAAVENFTSTNKIYRSINKGVSWTNVFSSSVDDWTCVSSDGINHFYVGSFTGNFLSNNNGQNFSSVGPGIPVGQGGFAIGVLGNNVFVGNNSGVYFSSNSGQNFTSANTGFDPASNNAVQGFAFSATHVFAGTFQDAVWKRPLSDFGISQAKISEPPAANSLKVYPNPFSDQTTIDYSLRESGNVLISLYDIDGKVVYESQEFDEAGIHSKTITKKFPSGIYLLRLENGSNTSTTKVIVQ